MPKQQKSRVELLMNQCGGKFTDRYGSFQDFGLPLKVEEDGVTEYPVSLKVRTGGVVNHPYFGRIVNDFAGMVWHKESLVLDWNHNPNEEIGVIDSYEVCRENSEDGKRTAGDLICEARLLSEHPNDRAARIKKYSKRKMPYEVSMTWGNTLDGRFVVEDVPAGKTVLVNDLQGSVKGPISIIRVWGMYGAAVCHHGVDGTTHTEIHDSLSSQGATMPKDLKEFVAKFGNEKGAEYVLNDSIETLEQAERIHAEHQVAVKDAKITELTGIVDAMTLDNKKLTEDLAKVQKDFDEFKAKAEAGKGETAKQVEDATKLAEENARLKQALPGVNVGDSDKDSSNRENSGKPVRHKDALVDFFTKRK